MSAATVTRDFADHKVQCNRRNSRHDWSVNEVDYANNGFYSSADGQFMTPSPLCLWAVLALALPSAAAVNPYCAFEVKVSSPSGSPVPGVEVALIRGGSTTFSETKTNQYGVAKLCDSPLEYVDIVVGRDICGSILVRHIKPTWPKEKSVRVRAAIDPPMFR
jgi:hypothetical protein